MSQSSGPLNLRRSVIDSLVPYFRDDPRYVLLAGDMGFGAIDALQQAFPRRVINCGIMEPGATGIAAGMSMTGLVPILYTMVNFLAFRCLEQIRNDVLQQQLNVKFLGTGANDYFQCLGTSHCCGEDDVRIFGVIGLTVFDPYRDAAPFAATLRRWLLDQRAGYLRV